MKLFAYRFISDDGVPTGYYGVVLERALWMQFSMIKNLGKQFGQKR